MFTEKVNKIKLCTKNDKRIQSIKSIETHAYGTRRNLIHKEEIKCNSIKQYKND